MIGQSTLGIPQFHKGELVQVPGDEVITQNKSLFTQTEVRVVRPSDMNAEVAVHNDIQKGT